MTISAIWRQGVEEVVVIGDGGSVLTMPSAPSTDSMQASRLDLLAFGLLVASVITIAGVSISAASAPEIGVVDGWGRVDDIASRVASWEYVLVVAVASALLLWARGAGPSPASRVATATRVLLAADLAIIVVAAVGGTVALFARTGSQLDGTGGGVDYYTGGEKIGETVVYLGILVATVGVAVVARRGPRPAAAERS